MGPASRSRGRAPTIPPTRWLLTEAYWAGRVRAPAFGQAIRYIQSHIGSIVRGITAGYGLREDMRARRLKKIIEEEPQPWDERTPREMAELQRSDSDSLAMDRLARSHLAGTQLVRGLLSAIATAASVLALAIYAPFRAIPIKAIRERAELASLDAQLVSAFGDLPVLLDDPVQAAIVRERLAETIRWVRDRELRGGRADRAFRRRDRQLFDPPR